MLELEAVGFIFLIVEGFQLVDGELMELVEVMPPLVAAAEGCAEVCVGNVAAHLRGDVERAHREHVHAVAGDRAQRRGNGLDHARVDVRALAGGDVNAHAGAAEDQRALEFALGDH